MSLQIAVANQNKLMLLTITQTTSGNFLKTREICNQKFNENYFFRVFNLCLNFECSSIPWIYFDIIEVPDTSINKFSTRSHQQDNTWYERISVFCWNWKWILDWYRIFHEIIQKRITQFIVDTRLLEYRAILF